MSKGEFIPKKKIVPLDLAIKVDPPTIALFYKNHEKEKKKYMYKILLNELVNLGNAEKVTKRLFKEHKIMLDKEVIDFEQVCFNNYTIDD
jgi:hypothetical protein